MDRRDKSEAPDRDSENKLQKALKVIVDSYKGVPQGELYKEAIKCFDSVIEISHNSDDIRDFALRNQIDVKYLVDGANFVTSKMHFNPENNFYVTLGLPESASQDEVRERWKRLMLLYHPDRQSGEEEWVAERAKKVNEAYSTLKDVSRRAEYDRKLRMQEHQQTPVYPHQPIPRSAGQARRMRGGSGKAGNRDAFGKWSGFRRYLPKILIGLYVIIALAVIGFIYFQNNSTSLETELSTRQDQQPAPRSKQMIGQVVAETPPEMPLLRKEPDTKPAENRQQQKSSIPARPPWNESRARQPVQKEGSKETDGGNRNGPGPLLSLRPSLSSPVASDTAKPKEGDIAPKENLQKPDVMARVNRNLHEQRAVSTGPVREARIQNASPQSGGALSKDKVGDFIRAYSAAYEKGDINTFMTFFSPSAVENSMNYEAIRSSYLKTFSERIGYYRLQNIDIKIEGDSALVTGSYNINRFMSLENRWVRHSGFIKWKLSMTDNSLKIVSAYYDN